MNYNEVFQQVDGPVTKPVLPLFSSPEVRSQAVAQATRRPVSAGLLSVLRQGNSFLEPSAAREANLDALAEPGTVAVLTGQQAGLFLGPLFTIYKALSAVAACAALTKECGVRAVPVFWLQTEDHDFEEIRKTFVQDRDSTLIKLELLAAQPDPRCSVEYRILGGEVLQLHEVLREHLGHLPHAPEMLGRLAQCYCPGAALSSAFASFLAYLTARFGLVFFNPRWPGAAKLFQPVYLAAWERREEFAAVLKHQEILLKEHNLVPQVRLVENSPLFFMHNKSGEGARCRLLAQGSHWVLSGTGETASAAEVRAQLEDAPERFSSSALLRPLVQDSIFPSAVYIAGEAEMRYFVQILPLYDALLLPRPLVAPRASFCLVEEKVRRWCGELGIKPAQVRLPAPALQAILAEHSARRLPAPAKLEQQTIDALNEALLPLQSACSALDPTLVNSLGKTKEKARHLIHTAVERYGAALINSNSVARQRMDKLRTLLYPGDEPQERRHSALYFLCRFGAGFVERIVEEIEPFSAGEKELAL